MRKTKSNKQFINEAKKVHGDKYDYSEAKYLGDALKVKIICKIHGVFEQTPSSHLQNHGCKKCSIIKNQRKFKLTNEQFIKKAIKIHENKYSYEKVKYENCYVKVKIYCKSCKEYFYQAPTNHLSGNGCPQCKTLKTILRCTKTTDIFIQDAIKVHKNLFSYNEVVYKNDKSKVKIYCRKCKKYFKQIPSSHVQGVGCPKCNNSKGEIKVENWLEENKVKFEIQKKFKECINKRRLPFDFYLTKQNILIEYDGEQHFKPMRFSSKEVSLKKFKQIQFHDKIKTIFCKENNIKLIRISYKQFDQIENILKELLKV